MPPAAAVVPQPDRMSLGPPPMVMTSHAMQQPAPTMMQETFARDAIISWFRGEFAAANAIIDALCGHLRQLGVGDNHPEYDSVFAAIHRRRLNWIPIIQMQKYYSIAHVAAELRKVAAHKAMEREAKKSREREETTTKVDEAPPLAVISETGKEGTVSVSEISSPEEEVESQHSHSESYTNENVKEGEVVDHSFGSEITDTGSQQVQLSVENVDICSNHEGCGARHELIKITKGFIAKEPLKGRMVNVVSGLKLYEDIFTDIELLKLNDFVNELRVAGQNGELSGETFILYNQQIRGNKRELIQLGVPIFGQINDEASSKCQKSHIEPIPPFFQGVIDHLVQWHVFSENRKPNGCIINFFDEGEYSQPFLKPPHLDQPICTLVLSHSTMAFGRTLVNNSEGNYRGPLVLSVKEGSLLVMRGNSADVARHVMCSSPNKRVSITFFKIRMLPEENASMPMPSVNRAMTLWQPGVPTPRPTPNGALSNGFPEAMDMVPKWGPIRTPVVMLAPLRPMGVSPRRMLRGGTGVFLPWTVGSRRPAKYLPPRAQKGRFLALPSPVDACKAETASSPTIG